MNYGESWQPSKRENWRAFSEHESSRYKFNPYENRQSAYGPQHVRPSTSRHESLARHNHHQPYKRPPPPHCPQLTLDCQASLPHDYPAPFYPQYDKSVFITPNAGMVENFKHCKADDEPDENVKQRRHNFEDFSSGDESITINVKGQSTACVIQWSLSSRFSSARYHMLVEVYLVDHDKTTRMLCNSVKKGLRDNSYQVETVPGRVYEVVLRMIQTSNNVIRLQQLKEFKAIFSMSEINELFGLAVNFAGKTPAQKFKYLYRVKPQVYFDDIIVRRNGLMQKYIKDDNGHSASPINGELRGLFFSGRLIGENFPSKSPFGDKRFFVNARHVILPEAVNIYFADFYCNNVQHYVTIVCCRKRSSTDAFCKKHIKQLNIYDNPFIKVEASSDADGIKYNYFVNDDNIHVEICYTEDIHLNLGHFENVEPVGLGSSRVGGVRNNRTCRTCNLKWDATAVLTETLTTNLMEASGDDRKKDTTVPGSSSKPSTSNNNSRASKRSHSHQEKPPREPPKDEPTRASKRSHSHQENPPREPPKDEIPPKRKSLLMELLEKDRAKRDCPEQCDEISSLVSDLVERVGAEIDFQNFEKRIKEGIVDEMLLPWCFEEKI